MGLGQFRLPGGTHPRMQHLLEHIQARRILENDRPQATPVNSSVRSENLPAEMFLQFGVDRPVGGKEPAHACVAVKDREALLPTPLQHGGLTAAHPSGETDIHAQDPFRIGPEKAIPGIA